MRIGIDARLFGPRVGGGGLGRYVEELIRNLETLDHENEYVIFLRKENWDDYQPAAPNFRKVLAPWRWYTLAEQLHMPRVIREQNLDLIHYPHFNVPIFAKTPFVVTIHDLILLEFPSIRATTLSPVRFWLKYVAYRFILRIAIRRAKKIITVSHATRDAVLKKFNVPPDHIVTIHPGFSPLISHHVIPDRDRGSSLDSRWSLPPTTIGGGNDRYLLAVGNAYPHKNLDGLLRAFREVLRERPDLTLVLTGPDDSFREALRTLARELQITEHVIFTGFVDGATLDTLYKNATAYIVPSLLEGFCFPGLEAQSRGVPVIASDIAAHREVFNDSVSYCNPRDPLSMRDTILELFANSTLQNTLRAHGFENCKRFSWNDAARDTITTYQTLDSER